MLGSLVLGLLAVGCAALDQYREGPPPASPQAGPPTPPTRTPDTALPPPLALTPDPNQLPPHWYWSERQQLQTDRYLQDQWQFYNQNRQPPRPFQRPPTCTSTLLGGQIITTCR
jgi:hypothetical protein